MFFKRNKKAAIFLLSVQLWFLVMPSIYIRAEDRYFDTASISGDPVVGQTAVNDTDSEAATSRGSSASPLAIGGAVVGGIVAGSALVFILSRLITWLSAPKQNAAGALPGSLAEATSVVQEKNAKLLGELRGKMEDLRTLIETPGHPLNDLATLSLPSQVADFLTKNISENTDPQRANAVVADLLASVESEVASKYPEKKQLFSETLGRIMANSQGQQTGMNVNPSDNNGKAKPVAGEATKTVGAKVVVPRVFQQTAVIDGLRPGSEGIEIKQTDSLRDGVRVPVADVVASDAVAVAGAVEPALEQGRSSNASVAGQGEQQGGAAEVTAFEPDAAVLPLEEVALAEEAPLLDERADKLVDDNATKKEVVETSSDTTAKSSKKTVGEKISNAASVTAQGLKKAGASLAKGAVVAGKAVKKKAEVAGAAVKKAAMAAGKVLKQGAVTAGEILKKKAVAAGNGVAKLGTQAQQAVKKKFGDKGGYENLNDADAGGESFQSVAGTPGDGVLGGDNVEGASSEREGDAARAASGLDTQLLDTPPDVNALETTVAALNPNSADPVAVIADLEGHAGAVPAEGLETDGTHVAQPTGNEIVGPVHGVAAVTETAAPVVHTVTSPSNQQPNDIKLSTSLGHNPMPGILTSESTNAPVSLSGKKATKPTAAQPGITHKGSQHNLHKASAP